MSDDTGITITFDGQQFKLDDFELGELEFVEDYSGRNLSDPTAMGSMKVAVAFIVVIKRRSNPGYTVDEARKLSLKVLNDLFDETPAEKNGRPTKARTRA